MSSADAASFLAMSPFAPLLSLPGVDASSLLAGLSGGNNFSALIGLGGPNNPFGDVPAAGSPGSSQFAASAAAGMQVPSGASATQMIVPTA